MAKDQDSEKESVKYAWLAFLFVPLLALLFWLAKHLTGWPNYGWHW